MHSFFFALVTVGTLVAADNAFITAVSPANTASQPTNSAAEDVNRQAIAENFNIFPPFEPKYSNNYPPYNQPQPYKPYPKPSAYPEKYNVEDPFFQQINQGPKNDYFNEPYQAVSLEFEEQPIAEYYPPRPTVQAIVEQEPIVEFVPPRPTVQVIPKQEPVVEYFKPRPTIEVVPKQEFVETRPVVEVIREEPVFEARYPESSPCPCEKPGCEGCDFSMDFALQEAEKDMYEVGYAYDQGAKYNKGYGYTKGFAAAIAAGLEDAHSRDRSDNRQCEQQREIPVVEVESKYYPKVVHPHSSGCGCGRE